MQGISSIEINLDDIEKDLLLLIDSRKANTLFDEAAIAFENNEARYQLVEGCFYDYTFSNPAYRFGNIGEQIVQPHSRNKFTGTLSPNIFVGTLTLPIIHVSQANFRSEIELEVQSIKSSYRDDYRDMLELITEKCTDLLLQANSPVSHYFEVNFDQKSETLYQKFAFIRSVIGTEEFAESIHRIIISPVTKWKNISESRDIRQTRRFSNKIIKEFNRGGKQIKLPNSHLLNKYGLSNLPERIISTRKTDSIDTPENRFVKHALEVFLKFCTDINSVAQRESKLYNESLNLMRKLESFLNHIIFKEISRPTTLKLNSPVLQRKEGYREVLKVWLMFDLAAKLIWTGGDDIYSGGKKDIAILYEYWLFFKLLDLFKTLFEIEPKDFSQLIKKTNNGLNLQIKQGKHTALRGVYYTETRNLNIKFNYNRSFKGQSEYPNSGSWTTTLRPDYTLSIWPFGLDEEQAEKQELIVHIHFDAKYKIANMNDIIIQNNNEELDKEKLDGRKGIYKNVDLLKMHAYKDAIRRTAGAYVLYPGDVPIEKRGFHEIIPGLGAFPVGPSKTNDGMVNLKAFIKEVLEHFINRTSQREKAAYRTHVIHKFPPSEDNLLKEPLPETINKNRHLLPDNINVLIGYYNSQEQYSWIKNNYRYNFRMGKRTGSLVLSRETVSATYLLLHTKGDKCSGDLWRIISKGPRVWSQKDLLKENYPSPKKHNYLIIDLEPVTDSEFRNVTWDFKKLKNYKKGRGSAIPFTSTLAELMKCKVKN